MRFTLGFMQISICSLILICSTFSVSVSQAQSAQGLGRNSAPLGKSWFVGAANAQVYFEPLVQPSKIVITIWVPLPRPGSADTLLNSNQLYAPGQRPFVFLIGDGSVKRSILQVDMRPGSELRKRIIALKSRLQPAQGLKRLLEVARVVNEAIRWTEGSKYNDGRAEFSWDKSIIVSPDTSAKFREASLLPVFSYPVASQTQLPVIPFEKYLEAGAGYCLQKALLASLILETLGVRHRFFNGTVVQSPGVSGGHSWIELSVDGGNTVGGNTVVIFDPAWGQAELRSPRTHINHPDWLWFGGSWRFVDSNYLILEPK